ncbi:transglutaminase TgpA family protein [Halorubrum vacuolatum]|uniref:Transglutaminase-like enzyme, putative cysteine protease n=1 Tax=Halorubrum vacuolatum TaxID=63740 RepID=A0A238US28_HALVU|nr:transglutaminaseTgpA domain-containing protein [Halorubrum vacuolatum]SNR24838.1 Transglutaminase-like enzyme, putative cysteine protease [Halorubrum vacuolatum]
MRTRHTAGTDKGATRGDGGDDGAERRVFSRSTAASVRSLPPGLVHPATVGVAAIVGAYLHTVLSITDIVGGSSRIVAGVLLAVVLGLACSRLFGERIVAWATLVCLGLALVGYYFAVPESQRALFSFRGVFFDTLSFLTGLSVLRLARVDVWMVAVIPVLSFLITYLTGRGRHVLAAGIAGGILGIFVLSGDAGDAVTIVGVLGVALAAGATTLRVPGGLSGHGDTLALVLAVMLVASATITVIPAGATQSWGGSGGTPGLESTLIDDDELTIVGSAQLSPEVRFTIESDVEANWRTGAYDTYTGDGWVRSGDERPHTGALSGPPGETVAVSSTVVPETEMRALPAPWQAVQVDGRLGESMQVDERGTLRPGTELLEGESVPVESRVPDPDPEELRAADEASDEEVLDRYTQLPEDTPDRLGERTEEILAEADAENSYEAAVAIETYLIEEYDYSLSVERPDGDVADAFLFEMDAGYCTYFATTMVAMLRSQGVPAQFVTGYSSGEQVGDDEWVVRGQDAHAWVQVYFPEHGWVEFDPTPSAERDQVREIRLAEARADGVAGVDTAGSAPEGSPTLPEEIDADDETDVVEESADVDEETAADDVDNETVDDASAGSDIPEDALEGIGGGEATPDELGAEEAVDGADATSPTDRVPAPSRETLGYGLFVLVVAVAGAHHTGVTGRLRFALRVRLPARRRTPVADAERAFADLERLLAARHRGRRRGETPRSYLTALRVRGVDDRVHAVAAVYERAVYAGDVSREEVDEARRTVRRLAWESTPLVGRLFGRR